MVDSRQVVPRRSKSVRAICDSSCFWTAYRPRPFPLHDTFVSLRRIVIRCSGVTFGERINGPCNDAVHFLADKLRSMVAIEPRAHSTDSSAHRMERRSPLRRRSRGDTGRLSPRVIVNIIQAADLLVLLAAGLFVKVELKALYATRSDGPLILATISASVVTAILLWRAHAYVLPSLHFVSTQLRLLAFPLLAGTGALAASFFLMGDVAAPFRDWPFAWFLNSAVLLMMSRCVLGRLLRRWAKAGRLARRVAVVGVGDFSREFVARLRNDPQAYTIVGLYDDRSSRIPARQEDIEVRGTVSDLLTRSRQERIDVIAIALPLSAVDRIAVILDQIGSASCRRMSDNRSRRAALYGQRVLRSRLKSGGVGQGAAPEGLESGQKAYV